MNKKKNAFLAIALVLVTTLCTSFGQMYWKLSVIDGISWAAIFSLEMILGWVLHVIAAVLMLIALKISDLSIVYPSFALAFIWAIFLSQKISETVELNHIVGIGVLIIGIIFLGFGGSK